MFLGRRTDLSCIDMISSSRQSLDSMVRSSFKDVEFSVGVGDRKRVYSSALRHNLQLKYISIMATSTVKACDLNVRYATSNPVVEASLVQPGKRPPIQPLAFLSPTLNLHNHPSSQTLSKVFLANSRTAIHLFYYRL